MPTKYCFFYIDYITIKTCHLILENELITFIDNNKYNPIVKKLSFVNNSIAIDDFILPDFRNSETKFYTNLDSSTNLYKFLKDKLNCRLFTHKQLSNDELEAMYSKFLDYIVGDNILFSSQSYKARILKEKAIETDIDISDRLIPFLYLISVLEKPKGFPAIPSMSFNSWELG